jgi:hypothetical protein
MTTFSAQQELGVLPLPTLDHTLQLYLRTVKPLLTPSQFKATKDLADDFASGEGPKLQALLLARANDCVQKRGPPVVLDHNHPDGSPYPHNTWLEYWWEVYAYQSDRTPLAVNINCFQSHFKSTPCPQAPLTRAAWFLKGALDAKRLLAEGLVPPERSGKTIVCSAQYHRVFSTTRIPGEQCDHLMTYSNSRHVAVERLGHWYCIPEADTLTVAQLQRSLEIIKADAASRPHGPEVAALTGVDRSTWARARQDLLNAASSEAASQNYRTLETIESAVLHLILSDASPATPDALQEVGQCGNGGNIWFDKSGSHIVCENGAIISNLEHSSADAVVPARLFVYVDEFITRNAPPGIG